MKGYVQDKSEHKISKCTESRKINEMAASSLKNGPRKNCKENI